VCEAFQVEIDCCKVGHGKCRNDRSESIRPAMAEPVCISRGGAMQIEHPTDFFRRDTAMLFHQLNDLDMIWLRSLCVLVSASVPRAHGSLTTLGDTGDLNSTTSYAKHF
jgi:hypothetical protein